MNSTASASGYTVALALRHFVSGSFGPRAALREALTARLGERGRLALFLGVMVLYALLDPYVRAAGVAYCETVMQSPGTYDWVFGAVLVSTMLCILLLMVYVIQAAILHLVVRIGARAKPTFAMTRSIFVMAIWTSAAIGCVLLLAANGLFPDMTLGERYVTLMGLAALTAIYLVVCLSEATNSSLTRSTIIVLLTLVAESAVSFGINMGLEHLNDVLRSLNSEHGSA